MATIALDTNINFESNETFSIGESVYSYLESGFIQTLGIISFFPTLIQNILPTIDLKQNQDLKNKIVQLKEKTSCFHEVILVDSKSDYKNWGFKLSFTSYVLALPFKDFKSNPDVFDFFTTRGFCRINGIKRASTSWESLIQFLTKQMPVVGDFVSDFIFSRSIDYQRDETTAGLVGFEKSISVMKKYKLIRQENNKAWKQGSFLSKFIAYLTLDNEGNDYFNVFTPSIDKRIENLETRWIQIQTV